MREEDLLRPDEDGEDDIEMTQEEERQLLSDENLVTAPQQNPIQIPQQNLGQMSLQQHPGYFTTPRPIVTQAQQILNPVPQAMAMMNDPGAVINLQNSAFLEELGRMQLITEAVENQEQQEMSVEPTPEQQQQFQAPN
jgi:hypothetical protein